MTLKDTLADAILVPLENLGFYIDWDKVDKCEKIADDYAIKFAEWYEFMVRENDNLNERFTSKELIEMFKKEKGWI